MMTPKDGMAARQAHGPEGGGHMDGGGGVARRAGRALVLLGAALLPAGDTFRCVEYVIPTL